MEDEAPKRVIIELPPGGVLHAQEGGNAECAVRLWRTWQGITRKQANEAASGSRSEAALDSVTTDSNPPSLSGSRLRRSSPARPRRTSSPPRVRSELRISPTRSSKPASRSPSQRRDHGRESTPQ